MVLGSQRWAGWIQYLMRMRWCTGQDSKLFLPEFEAQLVLPSSLPLWSCDHSLLHLPAHCFLPLTEFENTMFPVNSSSSHLVGEGHEFE